MKKRTLTLIISLLLVALVAVGGTLAWLISVPTEVKNTFTSGDVEITLDEARVSPTGDFLNKDGNKVNTLEEAQRVSGNTYQAIPGNVYTKDPTVTVKANSEECYLFVEYNTSGSPAEYYNFTLNTNDKNTGWIQLEGVNGVDNVWYREVAKDKDDQAWALLKENKITVSTSVTKDTMDEACAAEIVFKAYAIQKANTGTAAEAWAKLNP